jgi:hypothetical protein
MAAGYPTWGALKTAEQARGHVVDAADATEDDREVVDHSKAAQEAEERARIAEERAERAGERAEHARLEAKLSRSSESRQRLLREVELHLDAVAAMRGAADLQREHAAHEREAGRRVGD